MPLCSVKDMPESSWVGVATGQFLPSMWRVLHGKGHPFGYYHGNKFSLVVSLDLLPCGRF